jgi:hypothetical protein
MIQVDFPGQARPAADESLSGSSLMHKLLRHESGAAVTTQGRPEEPVEESLLKSVRIQCDSDD